MHGGVLMRMISVYIFCLLCSGCALLRLAGGGNKTVTGDGSQSIFWEVTRDDDSERAPSYILGTLAHGVRLSDLPAPVMRRLESAHNLYIVPRSTSLYRNDMIGFTLPSGTFLFDIIGMKKFRVIQMIFGGPHSAARLDSLRPGAMIDIIFYNILGSSQTMEYDLLNYRNNQNKKGGVIVFTPPPELRYLKDQWDAEGLVAILDDMNNGIKILYDVADAYSQYNLGKVHQILLASYSGRKLDDDERILRETYLGDINRALYRQVSEKLSEGRSFVTMDISLIVGESGIVNLLRKDGYTVTPIHDRDVYIR